jgi:DNA-dependent RNA polymerase auxiliary subunit epsilon
MVSCVSLYSFSSTGYIYLIQANKKWLQKVHEKTKKIYLEFLNRQVDNIPSESQLLFEGEKIQQFLTEQLSLYSEWIVKLNEARVRFEEGKEVFCIIRSTTSWSKSFIINISELIRCL